MQHIRRSLIFGPAEIELVNRIDSEAFDLSKCDLPAANIEQEDKDIAVSPILIDPHIERAFHYSLSEMVQSFQVSVQLLSRQGVAPCIFGLEGVGGCVLGRHHIVIYIFGGDLLAHEIGLALVGKLSVLIFVVALVDHILGLVPVD